MSWKSASSPKAFKLKCATKKWGKGSFFLLPWRVKTSLMFSSSTEILLSQNSRKHWLEIAKREQHLVECITLEWISNINIFSCVLIFPRFFHFQQKRFSPYETRQCAQFCFDRWHVRGIFNQLSVSCDLLVNLKGAENWEKEKNCVVEFSFRLSLKSRKCLGSSSRNYHSVAAIFNGFQSEEFAKRGFIFGDIKFFSSSH